MEHLFKNGGLESCKDTNGAEVGLKQHYEIMVANLAIKPTSVGRHPFNNTVVADGNCQASLLPSLSPGPTQPEIINQSKETDNTQSRLHILLIYTGMHVIVF